MRFIAEFGKRFCFTHLNRFRSPSNVNVLDLNTLLKGHTKTYTQTHDIDRKTFVRLFIIENKNKI